MVLAILAVGQFVNVACGSVGYLLVMSGNERAYRNNTFVSAVVLGVGSSALIPSLGLVGAAVASALALVTTNLLSLFQVKLGQNLSRALHEQPWGQQLLLRQINHRALDHRAVLRGCCDRIWKRATLTVTNTGNALHGRGVP